MSKSQEIANLQVGLDMNMQSLARELSNAKKSVRTLSKDFEVASKSIDNAEDKVEAYTQALTKGNKALDATEKKLQMQNKQFDDLYKKTEKQRKQYDELADELKKAEKALAEMAQNGDKNSSAYKEQEKAVKDLKKALVDKLELIQKNSHKLQQYSTDIDKTADDMNKLKSSINELDTSFKAMGEGTEELALIGDSADESKLSLDSLTLGAKASAVAIASIFAKEVYDGAIALDEAILGLRLSLGLAESDAKALYEQINNIAGDGGYSFEGVSEAVKLLEQRFNLSATETEELAQSLDLLSRMGYETSDTVRFMTSAVNDWGMTHSEALDMIIAGEQSGLNISQGWLDTLVEYTPILSTLGVEGQEAFALVDEAVNATGMTTDQAMDMVKEFFLTLTDGSDTSKDAFSDIGLNIDKLKKQIDDGSITSVEAMQKVMKAITGVSDETERARILQEIFKGTIEYGSEGVVQAWTEIETSVSNTAGAMDEAKQAYEDSYIAMQQDLSNEWNELKQTIGSGVLPVLTEATDWAGKVIQTLSHLPQALGNFFGQIGNDIGNAFDGAYGKVLEFVDWTGNKLADLADLTGMDGLADNIRESLEPIDKEHKRIVDNIRRREEETLRKNQEYSDVLDSIWNEKELKIDIETDDAEQKIQQLTKTYQALPSDVKTILKVEKGKSEEETLRLYNLYEQLPSEIQTIIKGDNYDALDSAKTVQDILDNIPVEKRVSLLTQMQSEGNLTPEQLQLILDSLPNEERVKIETSVAGKEQVEQTKKDLNSLPKQATSKVNVDTGNSKEKVQGVKQEVESVDGKVSKVTFKTDTAQASKNVTGLKKNISDYDSKNTNKTKTTKFKTDTAQASKNVTGLKNNISDFVNKYAKTFKTTFNVVTKYSTIGSPTSKSKIARPKSVSIVEPLVNVARNTFEPHVNNSEAHSLATTRSKSAPEIQPIANRSVVRSSNILSSIDLDVNLLTDLENQLKKVNNQLEMLDEKAKNAFGKDKIKYLEQQIELFKQQQALQHSIANSYRQQQSEIKKFLSGKGYQFDSDGSIKNYQNALYNIEQQLNRLNSITDEKQKEANKAKIEELEKIKKYMQEYMDITLTQIPSASNEWWNLQNSIEASKETIEDIRKEQAKLLEEARYEEVIDGFKDIQNELEIIEKKLKHANGQEKIGLLDKQLELLKKQKDEIDKQYSYIIHKHSELQSKLRGFGFTFNADGDISNYSEQLEKLMDTADNFEDIQEILEGYFKIQNEELPNLEEQWLDLDNAIKDSLKDQLEVVKDVEDEITKIYEKQVQDRINLINKELDSRLDAISKEKDAYNKAREEAKYQDDYNDQMEKVKNLEKQLEIAKRDTSLSGQKKVQDLLNQLKEEQKKLQDMVQDKIDDQINDMFDQESDRLTDSAEDVIEDLEDKFSDSKIAELVAQALGSGVFTDIEGNVSSLEDALIDFAEETGELFGVLGSTIEEELIGKLQQAIDTFKDLDEIYSGLGVNTRSFSIPNVDYSSSRYIPSSSNNSTTNNTNNRTLEVNFNQPLVKVEGNVTEDIMPRVEKMVKQAQDDLVDSIVRELR